MGSSGSPKGAADATLVRHRTTTVQEGEKMRGLEFALNDIGLAVFTTLAPAAAVAYAVLATVALGARLGDRELRCLESWLILPLAIATVGLIASATHLGTPGNALYVFARVGGSPLSTEVFWTVAFLGTACSYWLACIYLRSMGPLRAAWLAASIAAACAFLWGTAHAYSFPTVVTWDTDRARLNLLLTAAASSAPLAMLVLVQSGQGHRKRLSCILAGFSAACTAAACASMGLQCGELDALRNAYGTAGSLVPLYPAAIAAFGMLDLGACALALAAMRRYWRASPTVSFDTDTQVEKRAGRRLVAAVVLAYAGVFGVRFAFYCFHMTTGVV